MNEDQEQQTTEVRETNERQGGANVTRQTVQSTNTASSAVILKRIVWYIAGVIIALLAIRIVLLLLGANDESGFVSFIYGLSGIFAAPFYGIFSYQPAYGISTLEISSIVAIAVYALIAWGVAKLTTLTKSNSSAV
jgi:hypothetical protein